MALRFLPGFKASCLAVGGLYQGPASVVPAVIALVVTLVFAWLSFGPLEGGGRARGA